MGVYDPASGAYFLSGATPADTRSVHFAKPGLVPLHGDWDGDGVDTIGAYDPQYGVFFLKNTVAEGNADQPGEDDGSRGRRKIEPHWPARAARHQRGSGAAE